MLKLGSVAHLATLLNTWTAPKTLEGTTDGNETKLTYTYPASGMDRTELSIDGTYAGKGLKLGVTATPAAAGRDPVLHYQSVGGDIPVDVTSQTTDLAPGSPGVFVGFETKGTIDGHKVDLNYDGRGNLKGFIDGEAFQLQTPSPNSGPLLGKLGDQDIKMREDTFRPPDRFVPSSYHISGDFAGVEVDEMKTPTGGYLLF